MFIVIFVGIGLAICTLVFEFWYYKYKKPMSQINTTGLGSSPVVVDTKKAIKHLEETVGKKRDSVERR